MSFQDENLGKNKIMSHPEDSRVFIGCESGVLYERSTNGNRLFKNYGRIFVAPIISMATTFDNKYLFLCDNLSFIEFDLSTRQQVNNFNVKSASQCVVSYNNQFLFTSSSAKNAKFKKWSIQTKQELHIWHSDVEEVVTKQNCSQDSKYQFIGYNNGWLGIFDIQKEKKIKNIQALLSCYVGSVAFTQDNQRAFIGYHDGHVKMIKWKPNASTEHDFDFKQSSIKMGNDYTFQLCLTRDDKNILVGSKGLLSIFNTRTRVLINQFKLNTYVTGIKQIDGGKNAFIANYDGDLGILNLKTMKMISAWGNVTNGTGLIEIAII